MRTINLKRIADITIFPIYHIYFSYNHYLKYMHSLVFRGANINIIFNNLTYKVFISNFLFHKQQTHQQPTYSNSTCSPKQVFPKVFKLLAFKLAFICINCSFAFNLFSFRALLSIVSCRML